MSKQKEGGSTMPKKKTRKSVAKRFKLSKGGKMRFSRPGKAHLLGGKSPKRRRHLRKKGTLSPAYNARMRDQLVS